MTDLPVTTPIRAALNADAVFTFPTLRGGLPVPLVAASAAIAQGNVVIRVSMADGGIETDGHEMTATWPKALVETLTEGPAAYDVIGRIVGGAIVVLARGTVAVVTGAAEVA